MATLTADPFEAHVQPLLPDEPALQEALRAVAIGCNGAVYMGSDLEAQIRAIKLLRARPEIASALGIGA